MISIHALLAESDIAVPQMIKDGKDFNPRHFCRRATYRGMDRRGRSSYFQSTLSFAESDTLRV